MIGVDVRYQKPKAGIERLARASAAETLNLGYVRFLTL
jgi:hypothetical protein